MKHTIQTEIMCRTRAFKNLKKKKESGDDFECLGAFDEGKFYRMLRSLTPSEGEFYDE